VVGIDLMLVFVVADVLCGGTGLMLAIAGNRRPGKLERQKKQ
jgi:hypothetical protein